MKAVRRRPTRSSRALRSRTQNAGGSRRFPRPQTLTYSHIQIQQAPGEDPEEIEEEYEEPESFIRNRSLQAEIEEELASSEALPATSSSATKPTTFAEAATMSARRGTRGRRNSTKSDEDDTFDAIAGPLTFESLGPFKYTMKKKKTAKGIALDVSSAGTGEGSSASAGAALGGFVVDGSESGSRSVSVSRAGPRGVSPNPQSQSQYSPTAQGSSPETETEIVTEGKAVAVAEVEDEDGVSVTYSKGKGKVKEKAKETALFPFPTPSLESQAPASANFNPPSSQFTFSPTPLGSRIGERIHISLDGHLPGIDDESDTQSTKDRFEAAMTRLNGSFAGDKGTGLGDDGFDTMEWDPDLPIAAADENDPEPLTAKPQPLTYTTVGSLVNPDAIPQFTAPNRIQREGSGRRLASVQRDHHDTNFHRRGPPPPLNLANSMQYTQQLLSQSPGHAQNGTPPSQGRSSTRSSVQSQHQAYDALLRLQSLPLPRVRPGNTPNLPKHPFPPPNKTSPSTTDSLGQPSNANEPIFPVNKIHKELPGMEKMPLQRMAKYDNPLQDYARSRLSDFSAARSQVIGKTVTNPTGRNISFEVLMASTNTNNVDGKKGELNRAFQFPPPGLSQPAPSQSTQTNPLLAALGEGVSQQAQHEPTPLPRAPPGYPQPLTAGPPGQRSSAAAINKTNRYIESLWANDGLSSTFTHTGGTQPTSPWFNKYNEDQAPFPQYSATGQRDFGDQSNIGNPAKPIDTLPPPIASKYYPDGLPTNMDGTFTHLPSQIKESMDRGESQLGLKDRRPKILKQKDLDDWFYQGQRRYVMTADDYITELQEHHQYEMEQRRRPNPLGPIEPPPKKVLEPIQNPTITMDQMKKITISEASAPLLNAAFGSLLGYAEKGSASRSKLSQFARSPAWQIDSTAKGNVSFFGEDWGPPPKRYGRDPRYQPTFHTPNETHWE